MPDITATPMQDDVHCTLKEAPSPGVISRERCLLYHFYFITVQYMQ